MKLNSARIIKQALTTKFFLLIILLLIIYPGNQSGYFVTSRYY